LPGVSASAVLDRTLRGSPGPLPASPRKPRVLQVITKLDLGGAESVAIDLIGALRDEVDFAVFAVMALDEPSRVGRDMAARLAAWNVPFFAGTRGRFKSGGVVVAAANLARASRRFGADVVHLHTEVPELTCAVATVLSPGFRRRAILRTVHNCELWIDWGGIGRWVTGRLARGRAIAVSQAAADADKAIVTRASRPRAEVVPNGVAPRPLGPPKANASPFRLLFAARFVPAKGPDLLPAILKAAHARTSRRDVEVTIAGTGPLEEDLRRGLAGVAPGWSIAIVPPIEQLGARLGEWDGVLMPSRFEGLGLLAIEAFLAGVPLVATDAPGLDEVIAPDYPLRAAVDDVQSLGALVAAVIDEPERAAAWVAPLRDEMIGRFSSERMAAAYAAAYRSLVGPGHA